MHAFHDYPLTSETSYQVINRSTSSLHLIGPHLPMNFDATDPGENGNSDEEQPGYERGSKHRSPEYGVDLLFLNRWSPRAMSGESLSKHEFMSLIEAARWAPSSYNNQPWRFLYALRNSDHWNTFFDLLIEFNQKWARNASVLMLIVSRTTFEHNGEESRTHSFDAGAAWENLALQGARNGLVVHAMEGFDQERAREELEVPKDYSVEAMVAIGKPGDPENLPDDLRERETPSDRKPVSEITIEGPFQK